MFLKKKEQLNLIEAHILKPVNSLKQLEFFYTKFPEIHCFEGTTPMTHSSGRAKRCWELNLLIKQLHTNGMQSTQTSYPLSSSQASGMLLLSLNKERNSAAFQKKGFVVIAVQLEESMIEFKTVFQHMQINQQSL